jgi:hypothetical protein
MSDIDYSRLRGIADEAHWNAFVPTVGGELVSPLIHRQGVKNADYLFRTSKVIAELKVLETEFTHTPETFEKIKRLMNSKSEDSNFQNELLRILKTPLQQIIKKANRQIRETKNELGLTGFRGVVICVNDGFRGIRPQTVIGLLAQILNSESYNSMRCLIYQTNHYVEIPESPSTVLLWAPMYSPKADDDLVDFVNDLGRGWRKYANKIDGPFDFSEEIGDIDWNRTYVVDGILRHERYVEPKD